MLLQNTGSDMNILLHGGGLDSTALFLHLVQNNIKFSCHHIDYGQVAADLEYKHIVEQCRKYMIPLSRSYDSIIRALNTAPNMLFGDPVDNYYVESRNITLIADTIRLFDSASVIYLGLDR
jgi:7-cyano-7-deazaguanine synthase in queuosine biosynthesis